jgi:NAD(P)-dependent dehydrogenase (short-subunit alcohol dehydrogenase family)
MAVNTLVLFEIFYLFNSRRLVDSSLRLETFTGSRAALIAVGICILLQLAFTYLPPLQFLFGTAPLSLVDWVIATAAASVIFFVVEAEKALLRRRRAIALSLAEAGFDLAIHCRASQDEGQETARAIAALGRRATVVVADLTSEPAVEAVVPEAVEALGPIGLLVNNASIFEFDRLASMTREIWDRHMAINLRAPAMLCQAFARQLPADAEGLIVNMVDERVLNFTPNYLSYSVSKMGLWGLTQVLARQLAPQIRVNGIGPGPALPAPGWTPAQFDELCAKMPLRRGTSPEEIADAVLFILRARSMTGQMLVLDGGQHLGWLTPRGAAGE